MTQHGDHERQPGEQEKEEVVAEELKYDLDFDLEDAIGQEMADKREEMREADVDDAWVPPPSGLEQLHGPLGEDTGWPLWMVATPGLDPRMGAAYYTYTDTRGRDVLPLFCSFEGAWAFIEHRVGFGAHGPYAFDLDDLEVLRALVDVLRSVDLVVVDPAPVPHPGRCATSEPGWGSEFTTADLNELNRLRGVARAWSERKAEELFGGAEISREDYEYLRSTLESEYMQTSGNERSAEDSAWSVVHNAIDMDRTLSKRSAEREAQQLREHEQDELRAYLNHDLARDAQDQLDVEAIEARDRAQKQFERGFYGEPLADGEASTEPYEQGVKEREALSIAYMEWDLRHVHAEPDEDEEGGRDGGVA
ncbi:MAG: hypothetical protein M3P49_04175 [Actinomycetota bacterium]|nr:hypothetical protein [Actinomycetota bacterium]